MCWFFNDVYFFVETILCCHLVNVNPFDQPAVEEVKYLQKRLKIMNIKILPDDLINKKIAAGEVLERPSSAVKELVENSIDANAREINIFIRDGGKTEIIVSDDGDGINSNQIELAVRRHATSKLSLKNFNNISSLGFRGEALPSIASVSEMLIKTKTENDDEGTSLEISSGITESIKPVHQKKGTPNNSKKFIFFYTSSPEVFKK